MGMTLPEGDKKRKRQKDVLRSMNYLLPVSHFLDYEIFSQYKRYKKDPERAVVGKFHCVTKEKRKHFTGNFSLTISIYIFLFLME